jgi:hypothetical protein
VILDNIGLARAKQYINGSVPITTFRDATGDFALSGIGSAQGFYLFGSSSRLPGNIWGGQKPSDASAAFSIDTDTSGVTGDVSKSANQSIASAAGLACDEVDTLSSMAESLGTNPHHLSVITFNLNRNGAVVSGAELDSQGDLNLYSSGFSDGASTNIRISIPGAQDSGDDWSTKVASGLAQAAYELNTVLDGIAGVRGANVSTSA